MLNDDLETRLLNSIEADNLVVFCGAGLSMANPSGLPSAAKVATICGDRYVAEFGESLPDTAVGDLGAIAEFFYTRNELRKIFIPRLVPWNLFGGAPNKGHEALADFLSCAAINMAVTSNFDGLVESAALKLGESTFDSCIDGAELNSQRPHQPLVKVHGCGIRDRKNTVWCNGQLADDPIRERLSDVSAWLPAHLQDRDLVFIGFWSDWGYLNQILSDCVAAIEPRLVILVDPGNATDLEAKAVALWKWANGPKSEFHHVQMSGDDFLEELRRAFCERFLDKLLRASKGAYEALTGKKCPKDLGLDAVDLLEDLVWIRRDLSGVPNGSVSRRKRPDTDMHAAGAAVIALSELGAQREGPFLKVTDTTVRVVQAPGTPVSMVQELFSNEPLDSAHADLVICAGALDDGGVPSHLVRGAGSATVVRPGIAGKWVTLHKALEVLEEADEDS